MLTITTIKMVVGRNKPNLGNPKHWLYLFFFLFILIFLDVPFVEFVFLVPLLFYVSLTKKFDYLRFSILILLAALANFWYFKGYGIDFMFLSLTAHFFFFLPLAKGSHYLMKKEYFYITIPSLFFVLFYGYSFTPFNNFWLNYAAFLDLFPSIISIIGSQLTTLLIILFNVGIFIIIKTHLEKKKQSQHIAALVALLALVFFITPFTNPITYDSSKTMSVLGIQSNIDEDFATKAQNRTELVDEYLRLSEEHKTDTTDLILWPEYSFTHEIQYDNFSLDKIQAYADQNNVTISFGSIFEPKSSFSNSNRYNTLYLISKENRSLYRAYEPLKVFDRSLLSAKENDPFYVNNISVGLNLCYEETYPYVYRKQIKESNPLFFAVQGSQLSVDNEQGLNLISKSARLRAIEFKRYIFRLETTGLTTIISASGEYINPLPVFSRDSLHYEIPLIEEITFYAKYGLLLEVIVLLLALQNLLLVLVSVIRSKS